jgi:eukaryotic-like serine/threonine-protein kinase
MSQSDGTPRPFSVWPTTAYPGGPTPPGRKASRCQVALGTFTGTQFRGEIACLLRYRLRTVALITLVPGVYFFVRNLVEPLRNATMTHLGTCFLGGVVVLNGVLTALLWGRRALSLRALRVCELAIFGSLAVFFGWLQYVSFHRDLVSRWADPQTLRTIQDLLAGSTVMRWFFLIVVYGVFIPNTWKRCALVVSAMALTPLVLTPVAAFLHGQLGPGLWSALFDMAVLLATSVAVAVFGSYRLHVLQEKAFEAQQLGQYRLKQRLGAGGMGEVYLAEHLLLRRPCAIKLIRPSQAADRATLQRFEREVRSMATLTHPNTVEVYDYGHAEDGTFYYVMEYLPGQNLESLVSRFGPLPAARAVHFLRQVCGALREAHGTGLLHRDVKPSNVLACERGGVFDVAKLLDFGLVQGPAFGKDADRLTVQGTILGSPPYMSPEQAAGKENLDARSDVYSLGGVAYFLLTGQPPFVRDTAMAILLAHAYEPVVPPRDVNPAVPADLQAVVLRCLRKSPDERYPDAHSLDKALAACQDAGRWSEEQAEAWWKAHAAEADTLTHPALNMATQVTSG